MSSRTHTIVSFHREGGESITLGTGAVGEELLFLNGSQGLGVGPVSFASTPIPGGHGSLLQGERVDERDLLVPVLIDAETPQRADELRGTLRRVLSPMDPRPLYLRVKVEGLGGYREMPVRYRAGLDGNFGADYHGTWEKLPLEFRSFDALWSGAPMTVSQQVAPSTKHFLSDTQSFFPVMLASSTVAAQTTFTVAGDAPTWPVWTITPPGEDLNIVHVSSGRRFYLDGPLTETVRLDMSTGALTSASFPLGELWDRVSEDSTLFELNPGRNVLEFSFVGASTDSMVHMEYRPRYLAAQ